MWILRNEKNGQLFYMSNKKKEYKVGRLNADLTLEKDSSISRTHAILYLITEQDGEGSTKLEVKDENSRYGTFINEGIENTDSLGKKGRVALNDGDVIQFGVLGNKWRVTKRNLYTACSSLSSEGTSQLNQYMQKLGGKVFRDWDDDCDYLTMGEITITVKVMYALLKGVPIVSLEFWRDLLKTCSNSDVEPPKAQNYLPNCSDSLVGYERSEFAERPERKKLFAGKRFVFLNRKRLEVYKPIVEKAGGQTLNLNAGVQGDLLVKPGTIVIQYVPMTQSQASQPINTIIEYIEKHKRRTIPEYEIGLAILHCSTEKYCNPDYKVLSNLKICSDDTVADSETVFAANTSFVNTNNASEAIDVFIKETEENSPKAGKNTESMPNICVTESASVDSQGKRKRSNELKNPVTHSTAKPLEIDGEDEQDFFAFNKRPHLEASARSNAGREAASHDDDDDSLDSMENCNPMKRDTRKSAQSKQPEQPRSSSKALPNVSVTKPKRTMTSTQGFLEKNGGKNARHDLTRNEEDLSKAPSPRLENPRKRKHIGVISDNDDDGDDGLFDFIDDKPPARGGRAMRSSKKSRQGNISTIDSNDDEDFLNFTGKPKRSNATQPSNRFRETASQRNSAATNDENGDDVATQPYMPAAKSSQDPTAMPFKPKPKEIPAKDSIIGWLSSSMRDTKIKDEVDAENVKTENEVDTKPTLPFEGGCVVVKASTKSVHRPRVPCLTNLQNISASNGQPNGGKNFKLFVKQNYICQGSLTSTTSNASSLA